MLLICTNEFTYIDVEMDSHFVLTTQQKTPAQPPCAPTPPTGASLWPLAPKKGSHPDASKGHSFPRDSPPSVPGS